MAGGRGPGELPGGAGSNDPVELIGVGPGSGRATGSVDGTEGAAVPVTDGSRATAVAVVGGLLAVVGLLWALGRPGDPEATVGPETTVGPEESGGPAESGATAPDSTVPVTAAPFVPPTTAVFVDAPVVGERSDLILFAGGDGPLRSIDLDSGRLRQFGVTAHPVLATGRDLVLHQEATGIVGWVPLDDPGQQVLSWKRGQVAPGLGPGLLWVLDVGTDEPHPAGVEVGFGRWELFDTVANRRLLRQPGDLDDGVEAMLDRSPRPGGAVAALRPGPWFSSRPDGVYRAIEDGYVRIADGRALANDDRAVLVGTCAFEGPCDLAWVEVESGRPIDRPLPGVRPRVANLVAGGAWLHSVGWDGTSEFVELATGRRIEHRWDVARPTISPDGRWLAAWMGSAVVIWDLEAGEEPQAVGLVDVLDTDRADGDRADSLLFVEAP